MRLLKRNPLALKLNTYPGVNEGQQLAYTSYRHFIQPSGSQIQGSLNHVCNQTNLSRDRESEPGTCLVPLVILLHSGDLSYMNIIFCKAHRLVVDCD